MVELRFVDGINKKHVDIQCHREFKLGKTVQNLDCPSGAGTEALTDRIEGECKRCLKITLRVIQIKFCIALL